MKKLSPLRSIRQKCLDCSAGSSGDVRECPFEGDCPLWGVSFWTQTKGGGYKTQD